MSAPAWYRRLVPSLPVVRPLILLLAAICAYSLAIWWIVTHFKIPSLPWGKEATALTGALLGFLVNFRNVAAYSRWWEARTIWGSLVNNSRNLALKAKAQTSDTGELGALISGFAHALREHLRGHHELQRVPGFQSDPATPRHVPAHLAGRIHGLIATWRREGRIDSQQWLGLDTHASALMDVCGACERIRNTPIAASYRALLRHIITVYMLTSPVLLISDLGLGGVASLLVVAYFLIGVELAAEHVEQPFGLDRDDLPLERYCHAIDASLEEILGHRLPSFNQTPSSR